MGKVTTESEPHSITSCPRLQICSAHALGSASVHCDCYCCSSSLQTVITACKSSSVFMCELVCYRSMGSRGNSKKQLSLSAMRSSRALDGGASGQGEKGMVLPFDPLHLTFHDLNYYVDLPKVTMAAQFMPRIFQLLRRHATWRCGCCSLCISDI